jgi:hypothetical protein
LIGSLLQNNVLISDGGRAMLAGFSEIVVGDLEKDKIHTPKEAVGMTRWTAPDILEVDPFSPRLRRKDAAADVFAFGRLCLSVSAVVIIHQVSGDAMVSEHTSFNQISIKKSPFHPIHENLIWDMVESGVEPNRPTETECEGVPMTEELWSLARDCWKMDAKQRPTIGSVLERL